MLYGCDFLPDCYTIESQKIELDFLYQLLLVKKKAVLQLSASVKIAPF